MDQLINLLPVSVTVGIFGKYKYFCNETILHTKHGTQSCHMQQTCTTSIPLTESQFVHPSLTPSLILDFKHFHGRSMFSHFGFQGNYAPPHICLDAKHKNYLLGFATDVTAYHEVGKNHGRPWKDTAWLVSGLIHQLWTRENEKGRSIVYRTYRPLPRWFSRHRAVNMLGLRRKHQLMLKTWCASRRYVTWYSIRIGNISATGWPPHAKICNVYRYSCVLNGPTLHQYIRNCIVSDKYRMASSTVSLSKVQQ